MTIRLHRPCGAPGCAAHTTKGGYCPDHTRQHVRQERKQADAQRPKVAARGYDARWQKFSNNYRKRNVWCVECSTRGRYVFARAVDHIVPLRDRPDLKYDLDNLQALCWPCHSRKTARGG